jgi:Xaa-Pro aminopeptidase
MIYEERVARTRAAMRGQNIDLLLLTPASDLFYLTGMRGHLYERLACCLVTMDEVHFISPRFEIDNLKEDTRRLIACHGWDDGQDPFALLDDLLPGSERTMAVGTAVPSWVLLGLQTLRPNYICVSADTLMRGLRMVKDEQEYRLLKQVQERSCNALLRLLEHGVCGMTEWQAGKLLMQYSDENGVDSPYGVPIVAAGTHSALPHHEAGDAVIKPGDVLVIDFGGENKGEGYIADTTRTFAVKSIPDGLQEIYDIVKAANQSAFEAVKPGVRCCDVDKAARDVISEAGYGKYFTHRVGHGLGLDVHEHPYLSSDNIAEIQTGNVFSDEPGIYLPGKFGVRIEDLLFVRPDGAERLTPLDHELHVID